MAKINPLSKVAKSLKSLVKKADAPKDAARKQEAPDKKKVAAVPKAEAEIVPKSELKSEKKAKKSKASKVSKKTEVDDDLLAGESDGGDEEPIEGLEEMEAIDIADQAADDIADVAGEEDADDIELAASSANDDEVILTDAEGRRLCRVRDCDQAAIVETYCRFHYLQNWKRIQVRRKILADGKLERYVIELTGRYPDKFLEMIRRDLRTEKDFLTSIAELEIDESGIDNEFEDESQSFIDEVRGVTETNISDDDEF